MTIPELAERIEQRLAELQQKIGRLQAADQAVAATRIEAAVAVTAADPRPPQPASPRHPTEPPTAAPDHAAARRASKPAAVLALTRELDAGLRNRPGSAP